MKLATHFNENGCISIFIQFWLKFVLKGSLDHDGGGDFDDSWQQQAIDWTNVELSSIRCFRMQLNVF